ncbi:MAG: 3-phosphoshikimate 1-carboxyvinyltransferase [Myxococcota bacterium]|nr:3-phosphoshikimate 1-carboxyvinyltransferase [Myxococcota bacterium]
MDLIVEGGSPLQGEIEIPADKSLTHRGLMLGSLLKQAVTVKADGAGADNYSTAQAMRSLGANIQEVEGGWFIGEGGLETLSSSDLPIDCGNSGTTIRLLSGILVGAGIAASLTGDESLSIRPMARVGKPLRACGGSISGVMIGEKERPPLSVQRGSFAGGVWEQGVASAQVKSALLLAGLCAEKEVEVREPHESRTHTECMLKAMGAGIRSSGGAPNRIQLTAPFIGELKPPTPEFNVPGDISSAAFWLVAAQLIPNSGLTLRSVGLNSSRDGVLRVLRDLGADLEVKVEGDRWGESIGTVIIKRKAELPDMDLDISGPIIPTLIDELVCLAALGTGIKGRLTVANARELRVKESDRIEETARLLRAFGAEVEEFDDGFQVFGPVQLQAADIDVGTDHRIALTGAVLAMAASGTSHLRNFQIASVSYPDFVEHGTRLGAKFKIDP